MHFNRVSGINMGVSTGVPVGVRFSCNPTGVSKNLLRSVIIS